MGSPRCHSSLLKLLLCQRTHSTSRSENNWNLNKSYAVGGEKNSPSPVTVSHLHPASYFFRHSRAPSWHDTWPVRVLSLCLNRANYRLSLYPCFQVFLIPSLLLQIHPSYPP